MYHISLILSKTSGEWLLEESFAAKTTQNR